MNWTYFTTVPNFTQEASSYRRAHPATYDAQVVLSILVAILGLWSTFGNLLTMLAIGMCKEMHKKSNYFIFSLVLSDFISGLIASPLWLYRRTWGFHNWMWGDFSCKLFWFVDESTSYCTATHIASFAIFRYIRIRWPNAHVKISKKKVKIWITFVWIVTVTFGGAVFCTFFGADDTSAAGADFARRPSCSIIAKQEILDQIRIYYTFSSTTFMLFPMIVLFITSVLIIREFFGKETLKSELRRKTEKRAIGQLAVISAAFFFGYIPNIVYMAWTSRAVNQGVDYRLDYWVHMGCYFALRTSECMNPIIYNASSTCMRVSTKKVLRFLCNGCRSDVEVDFLNSRKGKSVISIREEKEKYHRSQATQADSLDVEMTAVGMYTGQ